MMRYYLAHSCHLIESVRKWELKIQGKYKIDLINPFTNNEFENIDELKQLKTKKQLHAYNKTLDLARCQDIVEHDLEILRKCDGVVAIFNEPTIGTAQEIITCVLLYRMPCYVICRREHRYHPWIQYLAYSSGGAVF